MFGLSWHIVEGKWGVKIGELKPLEPWEARGSAAQAFWLRRDRECRNGD